MTYIVWVNGYESSYPHLHVNLISKQGNGYFVSYKDKLSDNWSDKYFEAKRYKTLGSALGKLGLHTYSPNIEHFKLVNTFKTLESNRNEMLNNILDIKDSDSEVIKNIVYNKGRIDIVDDNNNLVGDAIDEIIKYYTSKFKEKIVDEKSSYIEEFTGDDFWEGF
jgi:hypothetical protein